MGLSELETFKRIFTSVIIDRIVTITNSYAERARRLNEDTRIPLKRPRPWKPVNSTDIWRFIGSLLYMGYRRLQNHEKHWSEGGRLTSCISLVR
jgi:Transposase IS4